MFLLKKLEKFEDDVLHKSIEFISDYGNEGLTLQIADIVLLKSADNYVEILYREDHIIKKNLIRNTLKSIELQLKPYSNFIRCHRTSIVNTFYIDKLTRRFNNHLLIIKGYDESIHVSRQYLLKVKEAL